MNYVIYLGVLLIWATTPLAIKLGASDTSPLEALSLRIVLAFLVGAAIATLMGRFGLNIRERWQHYLAASLGIFPNFVLVYYATQFISSGLVSLLFALSPFVMAPMASRVLGEAPLRSNQLVALLMALAGLTLIFYDQININATAYIGVGLMMGSVSLFAISNIWMKYLGRGVDIDPAEQTLGAMAFSLPGILLCWYWIDGMVITVPVGPGLFAIAYLSVFGSLVGFVAYFYLLKRMTISSVSLIPLITPGLALLIGALVANETVSGRTIVGAVSILFALSLHQGILQSLVKIVSRRQRMSL